ncbi:MAG: phospholipase D-like domain-containing protein [Bacteroidota bacterium]
MLEYLEADLITNLKDAKSISIAVALIKDYGLKKIENSIDNDLCIRKYLVGIHLPTPPDILRRLLDLQQKNPNEVAARIYDSNENYHPKVYIVEKTTGELIAFIGSANATRGGFTHNIEMNVAITCQEQCKKLQNWFDTLFNSAKQYDEEYIKEYEITFKKNRILASTQKSNVDELTNNSSPVPSNNLIISSSQFFRQSDFDAFALPTQHNISSFAVELRANVKERLIELSEMTMDSFLDYNIINLHLPYRRNLYVSQHFHSRGHKHIAKESIWLNFGKSRSELNNYQGKFYQSFVNHLRIQIILRNSVNEAYIGIWLYVSKVNSSLHDKKHLIEGLKKPDFVERLYEYIVALGGAYWITLGNNKINICELENSKQLVDFLSRNVYKQELIIGRNYQPNDSDLSEDNIAETVLIEFSKLYKIYDLIKAPIPIIQPLILKNEIHSQ